MIIKIRSYIMENDPIHNSYNFNGVPIFIEWGKGEVRSYPGSPYKNKMHYDYGYIPGTMTTDGMETDVCIYDRAGQNTSVGVLRQLNSKTGKFDEYKVMMGFPDEKTMKESYIKTMAPKMYGGVTIISWEDFIKRYLLNAKE